MVGECLFSERVNVSLYWPESQVTVSVIGYYYLKIKMVGLTGHISLLIREYHQIIDTLLRTKLHQRSDPILFKLITEVR